MATLKDVKKDLSEVKKPTDLRALIKQSASELANALPEHMRPERLVRIALTCIRINPKLMQCTSESFLGALFTAAQLGIEPIAGQAYILPFRNNRKVVDANGREKWQSVMEAQFVLGYKGLGSLFYRHEKAIQLSWGIIHEKDTFDFEYGTNSWLKHKPNFKEKGDVVGYYVIAELAKGGKPFQVMSREDCLVHARKHSKTFDKKKNEFYKDSPWNTNTDAMCLKTVLIHLGKLLPLSVEIQRAIVADETSRDYRRGIDSVLDIPSTTNWTEPPQLEKQKGQATANTVDVGISSEKKSK